MKSESVTVVVHFLRGGGGGIASCHCSGGWGWGIQQSFFLGMLRHEFQTLTLLYTIFDRKGTPLVYLRLKLYLRSNLY